MYKFTPSTKNVPLLNITYRLNINYIRLSQKKNSKNNKNPHTQGLPTLPPKSEEDSSISRRRCYVKL